MIESDREGEREREREAQYSPLDSADARGWPGAFLPGDEKRERERVSERERERER